jgi:hypothetical protein
MQDASFAQLSVSRLQQTTIPALKDCAKVTLHIDDFFVCGSLQTTDAYHRLHSAFPKGMGGYVSLS